MLPYWCQDRIVAEDALRESSGTEGDVNRTEPAEQCRLVLISPPGRDWRDISARLVAAMDGGDIASILLWPHGLAEDDFQRLCEAAVPRGQSAGIAMIVAGELRMARRVRADGIHVEAREELARYSSQADDLILGAGGARTRHDALELGELRPDYLLFGRPGYDTRPEPHPRNLRLGEWWSAMVEIPCIVLAGSELASIRATAATGAEFIAASEMIFGAGTDPAQAVREANRLLEEASMERGEAS